MLFFAVSALEKIKHLPKKNLINFGLGLLILLVLILVIKQARKMNKYVLLAIVLVTCAVLSFNWVYMRNEPKFLTPMVDAIAPFFPSAPSTKDHW
jgi:MFS superfamily sulfate permease-like transporter